jgi:hypothetical protein
MTGLDLGDGRQHRDHQRLEAFYDCPPDVPIAIVPDDGSWMAVMSAKVRTRYPHWARRVEYIQKRLREIYVLKDGAGEPTSNKDRPEAVSFCSYRGIADLLAELDLTSGDVDSLRRLPASDRYERLAHTI